MTALAALVVVAAVAGAGLWYYTNHGNDEGKAASSPFQPAPDFELQDASGAKHQLKDWRGSVVVLHFWASWCPPCLGEIPQWVELGNEFKGRKLKLVAVSEDEKWEDALKVLPTKSLPENIVSVIDPKNRVADRFGSYQFPETYLINAEGRIVAKWIGSQEWKSPKMLELLGNLAKNAENAASGK